jgi:hypothetical protein
MAVPQPPKPEFSRLNTHNGATHRSKCPARTAAPVAGAGQCTGRIWATAGPLHATAGSSQEARRSPHVRRYVLHSCSRHAARRANGGAGRGVGPRAALALGLVGLGLVGPWALGSGPRQPRIWALPLPSFWVLGCVTFCVFVRDGALAAGSSAAGWRRWRARGRRLRMAGGAGARPEREGIGGWVCFRGMEMHYARPWSMASKPLSLEGRPIRAARDEEQRGAQLS